MTNPAALVSGLIVALMCGTWGCEADDPEVTGAGGQPAMGGDDVGGAMPMGGDDVGGAMPMGGAPMGGAMPMGGAPADCDPHPEDYPGDAWGACISDEGRYEVIDPNISSIARIASFETIADRLWRAAGIPSAEDFIAAREEYSAEDLLDSRVQRRYDPHYAAPEDGSSCRDPGVPDTYPDYCVGPAQILPEIVGALTAGAAGETPAANAARVEAGLLWFLHVSVFKEASTCATKSKDCDSSWAYYTGAEQVDGGMGYAGYIREIEPATHQRLFDAILALRCWREQDNDPMSSSDRALHQRALRQLDAALDRALAALLIDRLGTWATAQGDAKAAAWAFVKVLGPVADRAARAKDAGAADRLAAAWATDGADADGAALVRELEALFPCP